MWSTVTSDTVMSRFNAAERTALESIQGAGDQLAEVLNSVIKKVRGTILAGGNRLGPDGTTPDQLEVEIISLALWLWLTGFSKNEKLQTEGRRQNYTNAIDLLKEIAAGKIKVEIPQTPVDTAGTAGQIENVNHLTRIASRDKLSGL